MVVGWLNLDNRSNLSLPRATLDAIFFQKHCMLHPAHLIIQ